MRLAKHMRIVGSIVWGGGVEKKGEPKSESEERHISIRDG